MPMMRNTDGNPMYRKLLKRQIDFVLALSLLVLLAPLLMLAALAIRLESPGPLLFAQCRLGLGGRTFKLYKFRSMLHVQEQRHHDRQVYAGDPEVTCIGRLLRRFKIDELPQLINVLKGDMSLIGPRPCLPELQARFDENGKRRTAVRPGLTGLAQVSGNIFLSWPERWRLDRTYVDNLSFTGDCKILLRTVYVIVVGEHRLSS
jgi:undecaprenyl phosphate N,N'-diacetylbacillosamine 1-phosphate transferase